MSSEVASLQADVKEYQKQLETVVSSLQNDPDNAELVSLQTELEEAISVTQTAIAELIPVVESAQTQNTPSAPSPPAPTEEKWSREKHPAFQPGYKRPGAPSTPPLEESPAAVSFKVNDMVLAKWASGDKSFYPARITSITGSSAAPVYNVTFKSYGNSETLRGNDIKPISNDSKKRKADASSSSSAPVAAPAATAAEAAAPPSNPNVISAAASIDPDLASQAKREPSKVSDGPIRPPKAARKVKAKKELEAGKSKWQDFNAKGKFGKGPKKDSMFRTGESINARVGFTGSGQAMRKDPTRSRHIYQPVDDDA